MGESDGDNLAIILSVIEGKSDVSENFLLILKFFSIH